LEVAPTTRAIEAARESARSGAGLFAFRDPRRPPPAGLAAVRRALADGSGDFYTEPAGELEVRRAIALRQRKRWGRSLDPHTEVMVSSGVRGALFALLVSAIDVGDHVAVPDPGWPGYAAAVRVAGGRCVPYPLEDSGTGFVLDPDRLARCITPLTKLLVLNTPHNPTGLVLDGETLRGLGRIAESHNLVIVADEAYEDFVYAGAHHQSVACIESYFERTITISGLAKTFRAPGWRIGWAVGPAEIIASMTKVQAAITGCASALGQLGASALLQHEAATPIVDAEDLDAKRSVAVNAMASIEGIRCFFPQGAYFAFPYVRGLGLTSAAAARMLRDRAGVQVVPGDAFGIRGSGYLRFPFRLPLPELTLGLDLIVASLNDVIRGSARSNAT
jgi:aspartate/methionine/tyrosine aminotransferase